MAWLRILFNAIAIVVLTGFWSVVAIGALLVARRSINTLGHLWARSILDATGVEVEVEDLRGPDAPPPPYLVMANHTSHFDVISIWPKLPFPIRFVAKRELQYIPLFGQVLTLGAAIVIDRQNKERAIASMARARKVLDSGQSVALFPEGTRTPPGELGPLKKGPFHLAVGARVPILPIGVQGTGEVLRRGDWRIRPGKVRVRLGRPIATAAVPDDDAARAALADEVARSLKELMR